MHCTVKRHRYQNAVVSKFSVNNDNCEKPRFIRGYNTFASLKKEFELTPVAFKEEC